jgi:probable rRNA maturation factor
MSVPRTSCGPPTTAAGPRSAAAAVLEVEVIGDALPSEQVRRAAVLAAGSAGVDDGHVAIAFVGAEEIAALNEQHRGRPEPTDVLSFPVDEDGAPAGPRELGDVVICPEHTTDLLEAVVHGVLHLTGMDHEQDDGEMLAVQAELLGWIR